MLRNPHVQDIEGREGKLREDRKVSLGQWCGTGRGAQGGGGVPICRHSIICLDRGMVNQMHVGDSPASGRRLNYTTTEVPSKPTFLCFCRTTQIPTEAPAWQRCSNHITFTPILSSALQTDAKEVVALHLLPGA